MDGNDQVAENHGDWAAERHAKVEQLHQEFDRQADRMFGYGVLAAVVVMTVAAVLFVSL